MTKVVVPPKAQLTTQGPATCHSGGQHGRLNHNIYGRAKDNESPALTLHSCSMQV